MLSSLSDLSDYDSSDNEHHATQSRQQSNVKGASAPKRNEVAYRALEEESGHGRKGLLDPNDPFGDPFADETDTPMQDRPRMQCEWLLYCATFAD